MSPFIRIGTLYINPAHIVKIVPVAERKWNIALADGETIPWNEALGFNPEEDAPCADPIIPAPNGWRVILGACGPNEFLFEDPLYEDVIAFRLRVYGSITPITAQTGDVDRCCRDNAHEYAVVNPQGEVMEFGGRWSNVEAFLKHKRKNYDARAKTPAITAAADVDV
jgi:hypothetical protein